MANVEKLYPDSLIKEIVYRFTQEQKVTGRIKYAEVAAFSKILFEKGETEYKLSSEFWVRKNRQGYKCIDEFNKAYEATISNKNQSTQIVYVDTEECVNRYFTGKLSDKKGLIKALKLNENVARNSIKFQDKIAALEEDLISSNNKIKELEVLVKQYEKVMFSWFNASYKTEVPLINLRTTGRSKHPLVDYFFETCFSNPIDGYEQFENYKIKQASINSVDNLVTPIKRKKNKLQKISETLNGEDRN